MISEERGAAASRSYDHLPPWLASVIKFSRKNAYHCLAPGILIFLFFIVAESGRLEPLENLTINMRFRARAKHDAPADQRLLVVGVDEESLKVAGAWPWRRSVHGDLLQLLGAGQASVVSLDFMFTEPSAYQEADDDFVKGMQAMHFSVVTGAVYYDVEGTFQLPPTQSLGLTKPLTNFQGDPNTLPDVRYANYPIAPFLAKSYFGFVNCSPFGGDGIRRSVPFIVRVDHDVWPSFALQTLMLYWKINPDQVVVKLGQYVELPSPDGVKRIPINSEGQVLINYRDEDTFTTTGYISLCRQLTATYIKNEPWPANVPTTKDKIVICAQFAAGLSDLGPTPLRSASPLVFVHMNVLNSILKNDYLKIIPNGYFLFGWLLVSYVTLVSLRNSTVFATIAIPSAIVIGYLGVGFVLFWIRSIQIPFVWTTASFLLVHVGDVGLRWLEALRSKQQIKSIFSSYISPGVMNNILKDPDSIKLGGERKPVTIFFSDIRGFTSFSEGANEVELVRQLNEYFEKMVECVGKYEGTLHKYIGDAIMAVWGDVLHRSEALDAKNSVRCALAMRKELVELNRFWRDDGRIELKIGIGLNHGIVCVGNIGATQRREFTVIGDAVNLASRLEGVTKVFHTDFCIGESVYNLLEGEFLTRTLAFLIVKGKTKPVRVYEVLDDLKGIEPTNFFSHDWALRYETAFQHFHNREFTVAAQLFRQCVEENPDDFMSNEYLRVSSLFIDQPPGPEWDGVIKLEIK